MSQGTNDGDVQKLPYTKLEDNIFIINDRERQRWL